MLIRCPTSITSAGRDRGIPSFGRVIYCIAIRTHRGASHYSSRFRSHPVAARSTALLVRGVEPGSGASALDTRPSTASGDRQQSQRAASTSASAPHVTHARAPAANQWFCWSRTIVCQRSSDPVIRSHAERGASCFISPLTTSVQRKSSVGSPSHPIRPLRPIHPFTLPDFPSHGAMKMCCATKVVSCLTPPLARFLRLVSQV